VEIGRIVVQVSTKQKLKTRDPKAKRASKCKALSSNSSTTTKKKKRSYYQNLDENKAYVLYREIDN
jgi:hypothetical protein